LGENWSEQPDNDSPPQAEQLAVRVQESTPNQWLSEKIFNNHVDSKVWNETNFTYSLRYVVSFGVCETFVIMLCH